MTPLPTTRLPSLKTSEQAGGRSYPVARLIGPLLAALIFAVISAAYALTTPLWNNPDEPAHYNYVATIAQTGTLPVMLPGDWNEQLLNQLIAEQFPPSASISTLQYESWEPPLYYLLAVPAFDLGHGSVPAQVRDLRLFGVLLGTLTVLATSALAFELVVEAPVAVLRPLSQAQRCGVALAVPLLLAGVPLFTADSGSVSNDALANLLGAVLSLQLARVLTRRVTGRVVLLASIVLAAALLTKETLAPFLVLVPAALWVAARREQPAGRALAPVLANLVLTGLLLLPWLIRQALTYGPADLLATARHDQVVVDQPPGHPADPAYWSHWAITSVHSFWGQFGWMTIVAPDRLYLFWELVSGAAAMGLLVVALRWAWRWRLSGRAAPPDARLLFLGAVVAGCLAVDIYHNIGYDQAQGRFLYGAVAPLALFAVLGWSSLLPRAWRAPGVLVLALALILLNVYTLLRVVLPAWFAG